MPILIDCYNLLHCPMPEPLAGLDEVRLCNILAASPWAGTAIIVCDGVVKPQGPAHSPQPSVQLVYAGPKNSADDQIIQHINRDSAPRRLAVVTDDREIQAAAKKRRARVITCPEFIGDLARWAVAREHNTNRNAAGLTDQPLDPTQVDQWAREMGLDPNQQIDPPTNRPY